MAKDVNSVLHCMLLLKSSWPDRRKEGPYNLNKYSSLGDPMQGWNAIPKDQEMQSPQQHTV